jgi:hypothetical protein
MQTRLLAAATALAFAVAPLSAQAGASFQLQGTAGSLLPGANPAATVSFGGGTFYSSPYVGSFETSPGVYSSPFLVWCVDYSHESAFGDIYNTEVSGLGGSLADTRNPLELNEYNWAAKFASEMTLNWSSAAGQLHDVQLQEAIWYAVSMGTYTSATLTTSLNAVFGGSYSSTFYTTSSGYNAAANGWELITDARVSGDVNGRTEAGTEQEFMAMNPPGTPTDTPTVTPEPASLSLMGTGLAGVLGMGFRRRRKQSKV